jgi:flagellar basal-body rod protein FlgG
MIRSLWIAKTGMDAQQTQLDTISNNLANVGTTGYKRARVAFEDLLYQNLRQAGANSSQQTQLPAGLQIGTGVVPVATERMFDQGNLQQTGNPLDLAINGNGFFQVQMPDGTLAYTRDGSFHVDAAGMLVTNSGFAVTPAINIPGSATSVTVGQDGIVSITVAGKPTPQTVGTIQLASFVNPAGLEAKGQNLFAESAASGTPSANTAGSNGLGTLQQNFLETSNVNVVSELVNMIQTQRAYEMNSKAIQTADQMLGKLSDL